MESWEYVWPTLCCRQVVGLSPLLSTGWWYLSSVSPKRHCYRVNNADKRCRVQPLDPRPDAVALCSGCTSVDLGSLSLSAQQRRENLFPCTHEDISLPRSSHLFANSATDVEFRGCKRSAQQRSFPSPSLAC
ncbi:uncharacterized protein TNCV_4870651 [Trichonephila clavipes]|nr:uncharacterized protein TNCV_4870651 [Trichonephila clavipes]